MSPLRVKVVLYTFSVTLAVNPTYGRYDDSMFYKKDNQLEGITIPKQVLAARAQQAKTDSNLG